VPTTTVDYYQVLGVERSAGKDDIQRAYRKLARRLHPDVNKDPDAEERFKEINQAYEVLSDPDKRARYDRFGDAWRQVPEDYDPDAAGPFAGARANDGAFTGRRVYIGADGFDDLGGTGRIDLDDLFGGGRGGAFTGRMSASGGDMEAAIELSVEDAYRGGRRTITLQSPSGMHSYDVNLPAGVVDGQRIRLAGKGGPGLGDGPPGDLYLVVRLAADPWYRVDGHDLTVELPVTPWKAALGAKVRVDTLDGQVEIKVPAGSWSGRRLRGRGMPNPRGDAGDLYAEVRIVVPDRSR
jgi:curved DNA-binding protein